MSRIPSLLAVVLTVGMLAACTAATEDAPRAPSVAAPTSPAPTPRADVPVTAATVPPVVPKVAPTRLVIGDLGVDMPVEPVGVQPTGEMEIPENPAVAGWYRHGNVPADAEGATVIAAHVDDRVFGIGPLAELRNADAGQRVTVRDEDGTETVYEATSVTFIPRAELPVEDLFARTGPRTLVVITCGGEFDARTRTYSDNVVLIAQAVP